jgi:microcompartment protein CcmK/EutM
MAFNSNDPDPVVRTVAYAMRQPGVRSILVIAIEDDPNDENDENKVAIVVMGGGETHPFMLSIAEHARNAMLEDERFNDGTVVEDRAELDGDVVDPDVLFASKKAN